MSSPRPFRVVKPEIRILGIDDGKFVPHTKGKVIVVGVVLRGGCWLDGVMHTYIEIDGLDATEKFAAMINASPHRRQIRLVMLNGITFGGFNLVHLKRLNALTNLPVVSLTREKPDLNSIHEALKHLPDLNERWRIIQEAGVIEEVISKGVKLYMVSTGICYEDAMRIITLSSTRSCLPEPLRVAHLIASGVTS